MTLQNNTHRPKSQAKMKTFETNDEIQRFQKEKESEHQIQKLKNKRKFEDDQFSNKNKNASGDGEKPDWKKIKQERKEIRIKRKQSDVKGNESYELSVNIKKIWEELRREDCKGNRKEELCKSLYNLIKGKAKALIFAHDTVRVIETLLSAGGEEYRTHLFLEFKDDLLNLSKNKYARFFVVKLLRYGTRAQKDAIIESMIGHVVKLMRHKVACDVLELAYNDYANAKQRAYMIQEFFGHRFKLFKEDISTLDMALQKFPEHKEKILASINEALQPILDKGVFTNTIIHTLLKEYLYNCGEPEKKNIIDSLKENLLPILHTRDGARVGMLCLWNGTSKDRKFILKSFKGNFLKLAQEEHGYMVLLAAFDCIDDTVLVSKVALSELMGGLDELAANEYGRKVLKYLVAPRSKLFFHPHVLSVLQQGDSNPNSKKEKSLLYKELQNSVAEPILTWLQKKVGTWARDSQWTLFLGAALQSFSGDAIVPIFQSLAELCAEPFIPGEDASFHFLEVSFMAKMITFIIQCDKQRFQEKKPVFSSHVVETAETEMRGWVLTNRGCFVLIKLLETEIPDVMEHVSKVCTPLKARLQKMEYPGAAILLKKL